MPHIPSLVVAGTVCALSVAFAVPVDAKSPHANPTPQVHPTHPAQGKDARTTNHGATVAPVKTQAPASASALEATPVASPSPALKKDHCEKVTSRIANRLTHTESRAGGMLTEFDSTATATQDYYNNTVQPAGGEVADYGTYIYAIQNSRTAVSAALAKTQQTAQAFTCENPKASFSAYRTDVKALNTALKDYRKAVNALIEAVDAAAAGIPTAEPTAAPSAEPSAQPSLEPSPEASPAI
jgi:hypothetical protein